MLLICSCDRISFFLLLFSRQVHPRCKSWVCEGKSVTECCQPCYCGGFMVSVRPWPQSLLHSSETKRKKTTEIIHPKDGSANQWPSICNKFNKMILMKWCFHFSTTSWRQTQSQVLCVPLFLYIQMQTHITHTPHTHTPHTHTPHTHTHHTHTRHTHIHIPHTHSHSHTQAHTCTYTQTHVLYMWCPLTFRQLSYII